MVIMLCLNYFDVLFYPRQREQTAKSASSPCFTHYSTQSCRSVCFIFDILLIEKKFICSCVEIIIVSVSATLSYHFWQSAYIPDDLSERVYVCLKRMLTLPEPFCTVGLNYAKHIKIEQNIPGKSFYLNFLFVSELLLTAFPVNQ